MKLLFISSTLPPLSTPESVHTIQLCHMLAKQGIDLHLLTTKQEDIPADLPFTVHAIMRKWNWAELPRMAAYIKRCNPDVILLMYLGHMYNFEYMVTYAPTVCRRILTKRVRFVTQFENAMGARRKDLLTAVCRRIAAKLAGKQNVTAEFGTLLRDSDHLIFLSPDHCSNAGRSFPISAKSSIIPAPPLMQAFADKPDEARRQERTALRLTGDDPLILFYGYLYPGKGIDTLIRAFNELLKRRSGAKLIIIGGLVDYEDTFLASAVESYHALPQTLGITEKVVWTGHCNFNSDKASRYMYAADLCVLPFDFGVRLNNSSLAVVTKHSLPVITTVTEGTDSELIESQCLYLCPPQSPDILAEAMEKIISDPELRRHYIRGSQHLSTEYFSWEKAVEKTLSALASK